MLFHIDYDIIINELVQEFQGQFECLGENAERYINFPVPIKKGNNIQNKIIYIDNLAEGLHKDRCKNCESCLE